MSRIFVRIAAYRDEETAPTIRDLFQKAAVPERISVAVCWQYQPGVDPETLEIPGFQGQIQVLSVPKDESLGVCWARHRTELMWNGEEYTLQVDSHMRFEQNWDQILIEQLAACPSDKAVLSSNPPGYQLPDKLDPNPRPIVKRARPFSRIGNLRCRGVWLDKYPSEPLVHAFISAAFLFSKSELLQEVPYDPYLYFDQEEICYAIRLYTHGWTLYLPTRSTLFHLYNVKDDSGKFIRTLDWQSNKQGRLVSDLALKRFNHLTRHEYSTDEDVVRELDRYGLGNVRTLDEFELNFGLDFRTKTVRYRAFFLEFVKGIEDLREKEIQIHEIGIEQKGRYVPVSEIDPEQPSLPWRGTSTQVALRELSEYPSWPKESASRLTFVANCSAGPMILLRTDTVICRKLAGEGEYAPHELRFIESVVEAGQVVVDAGAAYGSHTLTLARAVGAHGCVHAFEPQRMLFQMLCGTVALNGLANVWCHPIALGSDIGSTQAPAPDYSQPNNFAALTLNSSESADAVRCVALDSMFLEQCDFIKIDVLGDQLSLLRGANRTLLAFRPIVLIDGCTDDNRKQTISWMALDQRYRIYKLGRALVCVPQERGLELELEDISPSRRKTELLLDGTS
ncbi:FkbM family methyltransferase [Roseiconus lacunae]|uniref:FkbM family methyltransferase n=1 Tax=Roseiconus lacunae TaxID=2605694 RepID=UPI001E335E0E|nr:FkbM family methyltransferase [Roseiconus lacunae]MCD0458685.1 FkbM family methyltransferase [Roseiconus lacunae]